MTTPTPNPQTQTRIDALPLADQRRYHALVPILDEAWIDQDPCDLAVQCIYAIRAADKKPSPRPAPPPGVT